MKTFVHEEVYRGADLIKKIAAQHITLCGVGAVGSNLADNLVRQGFCNFSAIDMDRVDDHNRSTQIWTSRELGQKKVAALQSYLFNVMKVKVETFDKRLDLSNVRKLLSKDSIIIDGFDNPESRGIVTDHCRANNIECLHIGLAEDFAEVTWNDRYQVPKVSAGLDVCEYPLARNTVMMAVVVGTESLIKFLDTGIKSNYLISLRDLKITLC